MSTYALAYVVNFNRNQKKEIILQHSLSPCLQSLLLCLPMTGAEGMEERPLPLVSKADQPFHGTSA